VLPLVPLIVRLPPLALMLPPPSFGPPPSLMIAFGLFLNGRNPGRVVG
jgi:hypothetical protein